MNGHDKIVGILTARVRVLEAFCEEIIRIGTIQWVDEEAARLLGRDGRIESGLVAPVPKDADR